MSGDPFTCCGVGRVEVRAQNGATAQVDVLVIDRPPLGLDMILGMSGISALGGVYVLTPSQLRFCGVTETSQSGRDDCRSIKRDSVLPEVDTPDFNVKFDPSAKTWIVCWKWENGIGPQFLKNTVAEYNIA